MHRRFLHWKSTLLHRTKQELPAADAVDDVHDTPRRLVAGPEALVNWKRAVGGRDHGRLPLDCSLEQSSGIIVPLSGMSSGGPYMGSSQMVADPGGHSQFS
jgi:hypothetical protein